MSLALTALSKRIKLRCHRESHSDAEVLSMAKLPSEEDSKTTDEILQSYFAALGKVAHAWNHLHEELGKVFCAVTNADLSLGMAIWHSLKSDRSQREILKGALASAAQSEDWNREHPGAADGILDLLKEVDKLADRRNNAIHAPCDVIPGGDFQIVPITFFGNDKAERLRGKDILKEFDWYQRTANLLRRYAWDSRLALDARMMTWPDKPKLPSVGQDYSVG